MAEAAVVEPAKVIPAATSVPVPATVVTAPPTVIPDPVKPATPATPATPEAIKYDLKLSDKTSLDDAVLERTSAIAREMGLSNENAQKSLNFVDTEVAAHLARQRESFAKLSATWVGELKADKEFGGDKYNENVENAKRAVARFGSDSLKVALDETGLGNHPELVRIFSKIGRAMADDKFVVGTAVNGAAQKRTLTDMYAPKKTTEE